MSITSKELEIITIKNRIELLNGRKDCENGNIVKKLKRRLRKLEA